MSDDLTVRLRRGFGGLVPPISDEAANEIECLRELNAELLAVVEDIPHYHYCLPGVIVKAARVAIAKAEKLK